MTTRRAPADQRRLRDIRLGQDAAHHLQLRRLLLGCVRVGTLVVLDVIGINVVLAISKVLTFLWVLDPVGQTRLVRILFSYAVVTSLAAVGGYHAGDPRRDPLRITGAVFLAGIGVAGVTHLLAAPVPWDLMALLTGGCTLALLEGRLVGERLLQLAHLQGYLRRRVLLVGDADGATAALAHFNGSLPLAVDVRGRIGLGAGRDADATGVVAEVDQVLDGEPVDAIVVATTLPAAVLGAVVAAAFRRAICVEYLPAALHDVECKPTARTWAGRPVLELLPPHLGVPQMAIKRGIDLVLAILALLLLSPLLTMIAIAIRLDSPGPVFFGQTRVGVGGATFKMWKFRTMIADAERLKPTLAHLNESGDPRLFKIPYDPRVTRVGRWLRRTSLDEIPQLFNVIRGEMSLVGPRPFFPEDMKHYQSHHFERLSVLPGITGLWQVSGRSNIRDFESVVSLDCEYIRRWSIGMDLKILLKTIPAVFRRDGAC